MGVPGDVAAYIHLTHEDTVSPPASTTATLNEEDILWTGMDVVPVDLDEQWTWVQLINVKTQRKMSKGRELRFVLSNLTLANINVSVFGRTLLRLS